MYVSFFGVLINLYYFCFIFFRLRCFVRYIILKKDHFSLYNHLFLWCNLTSILVLKRYVLDKICKHDHNHMHAGIYGYLCVCVSRYANLCSFFILIADCRSGSCTQVIHPEKNHKLKDCSWVSSVAIDSSESWLVIVFSMVTYITSNSFWIACFIICVSLS